MDKNAEKFLGALLNAPSPSGFEQPAAAIFRKYLKGYVDKMMPDVHGNSIAILNPNAKFKFMLAGHIDEIGLMVTHIDENGFLYVAQIGGMDPSILIGQRVKIMTAKGELPGVIGRKPIHLMTQEERQKPVKMENVWVDIGAKDNKEAQKLVAVGDPMVIDVNYQKLTSDRIISRACDDKVGAYVVAQVMRALSKKKLNVSVIGVATVQEEVGLRGAVTSSYSVKPDAGIAIDVGFASDCPEIDKKKVGDIKLGKGPALHRGPNINPIMEADLLKTAKRLKLPYQVSAEPRGTGTDANAMQLTRGGVATALISVPNRYMHSPVEMISFADLDNTVKLLVEYIAKLPAKKDFRV